MYNFFPGFPGTLSWKVYTFQGEILKKPVFPGFPGTVATLSNCSQATVMKKNINSEIEWIALVVQEKVMCQYEMTLKRIHVIWWKTNLIFLTQKNLYLAKAKAVWKRNDKNK